MATQPNDDEPLELTPDMELEPDDPHVEEDADGDNPSIGHDDEGEEQTVVAFDGEEPAEPEPENSTVRQMRKALREKDRELAELRKASAPKPIEVGEKPTLAGCEFDEDAYEQQLDAWKDRKSAAERQQQQHEEQSRQANEAWQADLGAYEQKKAALDFEDRDDVIDTAVAEMPLNWQVPAIIKAAADPALFLYALGKSEAKRAELAKINDPIKLAAAVARIEGAMKVTKGRKAPEPDRPLSGSARMPGGADKELEKLQKKADATGDRTELIRYRKELAAKGK